MDNLETRIYLFTGFLESGKTTFINDTIINTDFCDYETSVLIVTEEGEVEYNEAAIKEHNCEIVYVENEEDLTADFFKDLKEKYHPTQVLVEFNGMWNVDQFVESPFPENWDVVQILTTINASTFQLYVNNMRALLFQHCAKSDLVIFNRIEDGMKKSTLRNNIKAMNPVCQIIYENKDGSVNTMQDDELPYDYTQDHLEVADHDFGIFCYDAMEHPERYDQKTIKIKGKFIGRDKVIPNGFILGRYAMVCCEQDTSLIGMLCVSEYASKFIPNEWLLLEGHTHIEYDPSMNTNICVLDVDHVEGAKPLDNEYVTFD